MRKTLDTLYNAAAYLAALFLVGTLAMVLLTIMGRLMHFQLRGSDAYAGYLMAGSGFLALAHTLQRGEHIRVTVALQFLRGQGKRAVELTALVIAAALASIFAFYSVRLVLGSLALNDISTGNDATPLWIPQLAMALGTVIFAIAVFDAFFAALSHRQALPSGSAEPLHVE